MNIMLKSIKYKLMLIDTIFAIILLAACGPTQNIPPANTSNSSFVVSSDNPQIDSTANGNTDTEIEIIKDGNGDLQLSIPKEWGDIAIIYTSLDLPPEEYQDNLLFKLYEKTAHTSNESMGWAWDLYIYTTEAFTSRFGNVDPAEVVGVQGSIIGTDAEHIYLLVEPTDVQFIETDQKSIEQYAQLQEESQVVLEQFLSDNSIVVNQKCPDSKCYQVPSCE